MGLFEYFLLKKGGNENKPHRKNINGRNEKCMEQRNDFLNIVRVT